MTSQLTPAAQSYDQAIQAADAEYDRVCREAMARAEAELDRLIASGDRGLYQERVAVINRQLWITGGNADAVRRAAHRAAQDRYDRAVAR